MSELELAPLYGVNASWYLDEPECRIAEWDIGKKI